jgi:demethylmenaquinone methyltransferase/2-methoxy-6-polyprenyl-1,4-benzoquinol methylase
VEILKVSRPVSADAKTARAGAQTVDKSPDRIAAMFDAIAGKYDFLNHVLSAGLDARWRARAVRELHLASDARVLDVCTGTTDLAIAAATVAPDARIIGVDFAGAMLRLGLDKLRARALQKRVSLVQADATSIPLRSGWADAATIGFGIRNVADPATALREIARVLAPGGRLAILEFGEPRIPGIRSLYSWYFRAVLPRLGRLVSKHQSAYSYLPASVGSFPPPAEFAATISSQGFTDVRAVPISLGIVYLYTATRRPG